MVATVEEYGEVARFARLIVESGVNAFGAAESALQQLPSRESGARPQSPGAGWRRRSDYSRKRERAVHFASSWHRPWRLVGRSSSSRAKSARSRRG